MNDPVALRRRGTLSLPAPQVTDAELEDIVKVGMSSLPQLTMGPPTGAPAGEYFSSFSILFMALYCKHI